MVSIPSDLLRFHEEDGEGDTAVITVLARAKGIILGQIRWHRPFRSYVFFPGTETVFAYRALADIWQWDCGLSLRDWRFAVRIANVDIGDLIATAMANARGQVGPEAPELTGGKPVIAQSDVIELDDEAVDMSPPRQMGTLVPEPRVIGQRNATGAPIGPELTEYV